MTIQDAKDLLIFSKDANDVALLKGLHGIGKTSIVKQYCKENNYHYEELILSLMEPSDLLGMPDTEKDEGSTKTIWAQPDWFQDIVDMAWPKNFYYSDLIFNDNDFRDYVYKFLDIKNDGILSRSKLNDTYCIFYNLENSKLHLVDNQSNVYCNKSKESVLCLDELNRASLDTRQATMQLVLEKKLHKHILPYVKGKQTQIVAAINSSDEVDFQVDELDAALLDRFIEIDVDVDVKSWVEYAKKSNINKIVIDFILEHKDRLHFIPKDNSTNATPRSWEKFSLYVDKFDTIPQHLRFNIAKGKIGSAVGIQFMTYYDNYSKNITIKDIEDLVNEKSKDIEKIEDLSDEVKQLLSGQEVIKLHELSEQLFDKYTKLDVSKCLPLLATLYSLDSEVIMGFISKVKVEKYPEYKILANFDDVINKKQLFIRLAKYISR